jgi:hypothetical protein
MALCAACRLGLPGQETDCPACEAGGIGSELIFTKVELVSALKTREAGASRAPEVRSRRWAADNDLALSALALGIVSVFFALLGQGWFGILAVVCGRQARRQAAGRGANRVRTVLATTGLALGITAIVMMLASLVDGLWN